MGRAGRRLFLPQARRSSAQVPHSPLPKLPEVDRTVRDHPTIDRFATQKDNDILAI
jgi:hypothetical protein